MGNSLILLTYHTSAMGTSSDFFTDAIEWRVDEYYNFAMGGAAVIGNDNGVGINDMTTDYLQQHPLGTSATFTVESKTLDPDRLSAEITVTVTAEESLAEGIRLHVAVVETQIDMVELYGSATSNGQTNIFYVVRELLTDGPGVELPAMQTGETENFTGTFERDASIQNADSLRVTTWIQNESTKEVLAADATTTSAIPVATPIIYKPGTVKDANLLVYHTDNGRLVVVLPFSNVTATIFNINGRELEQYRLTGRAGQKAYIPCHPAHGILLLRLTSRNERTTIHRILFK